MLAVRQYSLAGSLVLLTVLGCDRRDPVEPSLEAASSAMMGSTVKAPSNTNAVAVSESRIDVSWRDNSSNETGFEVHRSTAGASGAFALLASTGAGGTSYSDAGLTPSTQYCYKVRAFRRADGRTRYSDFSNTHCETTPAPPVPTAPSGTDAKPAHSTAVEVRWGDNSTNESGFRIERSLDLGSSWTAAGTVGPNVTSSIDSGRASEQQACYRVIAFNAWVVSAPSNADCTTPPAAPTNLTATAVDPAPTIDLTWMDNSAVEDGYVVWAELSTGWTVEFLLIELPPNSTRQTTSCGEGYECYYYVAARKDGGYSDWALIVVSGSAPSSSLSGTALLRSRAPTGP